MKYPNVLLILLQLANMRKSLVLYIYTLFSMHAFSQPADTLSLNYCYKLAVENYPLVKQRELLNEASKLRINNINNNYLPQLSLNGQVSYQSEVTNLPINIPNVKIPSLYKDMYKATFDINQSIYDGGMTSRQKAIEEKSLLVDKQNLEVELYKLKERVNRIFFTIVLSNQNKEVFELLKENIKVSLNKIESGVKFGTNYTANADVLKAEIIKVDLQIIDVISGRDAAFKMLSEFTGNEINKNTKLILPEVNNTLLNFENKRPELSAFALQQNMLDANKNLFSSARLPRFYGFGEAGYGRPGLNMLSNKFDSFWLIGAKLSWNIWDWNQTGRQKQILDIQKNIVSSQKETFEKNLKILVSSDIADISKYTEMIKKDVELIELREKIVKSGSAQLENGVITSTEYVIQENELAQAKLNLENHKIQLLFSKIKYLTNMGQ